jgi:flagellar biosynthetic protein FlhB
MAQGDGEDRSLDATPRKLEQARERGEVPISREGSVAGVYIAVLIGMLLAGGLTARRIGDVLVPMLDQPDALLQATPQGWQDAAENVLTALALAVAPIFGLLLVGGFVPHLLQNSITVAPQRLTPKLSHLSPLAGFKRIFSARAAFEFGKTLLKAGAVAVACAMVARPLYEDSVGLVSTNFAVLPNLLLQALLTLLLAVTLVAVFVAGIDVPYQHWAFHRRMRMTIQEMKEELRSYEGDPHVKLRQRKLRRQRSRRRMMHDVPKATVVITNPTHFAVALKYERGKDVAPVVVAKGVDLIAKRIREIAKEHKVAIIENPPVARALHVAVEIGDVIPHEHFEAVAKIIGVVWAQRDRKPV